MIYFGFLVILIELDEAYFKNFMFKLGKSFYFPCRCRVIVSIGGGS